MKHLKIKLFLLVLISMIGIKANAYDTFIDGFYYNLDKTSGTATVVYGNNYTVAINIKIPDKIVTENGTTYRVTSIGDYAFSMCGDLISVTIPNSVTSIGNGAFYYCSNLTSITISNSLTSIGNRAFQGCKRLISVTIPNSVTFIGNEAFEWCSALTSITISNNVTSIGDHAFAGCSGLTSVTIPNSVTSISGGAFAECSGLTSVTIPDGVTSIGGTAFSGCSSLTSITIPNSVTSIGWGAFSGCSFLSNITLPSNLEEISNEMFEGCSNLKTINLPAKLKRIGGGAFNWSGITSIQLPDALTTMTDAFDFCTDLESIVIPKNVKYMSAFRGCTALKSIIVDSENPYFDSRDNCNAVIETATNKLIAGCESTVIPNTVVAIGDMAFSEMHQITEIAIPESIVEVGYDAFSSTTWYENQPEGVVYVGKVAYRYKYKSGENNIILRKDTRSISESAFIEGGEKIESIVIPASVTYIGRGAFEQCYNLKSVYVEARTPIACQDYLMNNYPLASEVSLYVPVGCIDAYSSVYPWKYFKEILEIPSPAITFADDKVKAICVSRWDTNGDGELSEDEAAAVSSLMTPFYGTDITSFDEFKYFVGLTSIDQFAFSECSKLSSLTIPNSVTSIEDEAFQNCSSLKSIIIPNSVKHIGRSAFSGCSGLTNISIGNSVTSIEEHTFSGCSGLKSIEIPNSVKLIGEGAFSGCSGLTKISIGNSVSSISIEAFIGCSGLTSIEIPNSVTGFGRGAFAGCKGLTSITMGNRIAAFSDYTFSGCTGLTSITIPNSVNFIGDYAFSGCSGLTSITIPNNVSHIGEGAFAGCTGLTAIVVTDGNTAYNSQDNCNAIIRAYDNTLIAGCKNSVIPNSVESVGDYAFSDCSGLTNIVIPDNVTSIGYAAFSGCTGLTSITIGNSVTSIGRFAFSGCSQLTDFYCYSDNNPSTADNEFSGAPMENATLHVPASLMESYKSTFPWSEFEHIVALPQITYIINGQTYKISVIPTGEVVIVEAEPKKEGYTFSGWSEIPATMPDEDVTVTGSFTINKYELVYKVDEDEYRSYNIEYGATIIPENTPAKEGYTFSGWSDIPATMPAHDVTVTGSFTINKYELTYMVNDEVYKTYEVEYGALIPAEEDLTKDGYVFSGWSEIPETMPAGDVTITGTFIPKKYTLIYIVDGKTYKTYEVECGAILSLETEPAKDGYVFSGWSEIPATMPARNLSVMGAFIPKRYMLTYIVDGEPYKTYEVDCGEIISIEPEPTKEGYAFSGWSKIPETMPARDVVVTGSFTKGQYKLIYMVNGETYKTISIDYGVAIVPEAEPEKDGYTFSGWSEIPSTMPAKDMIVTGSFTINSYKLTYMVDEKEYKTIDVEYGATITAEAEPTKDGYTFSGWKDIPATMPAKDVTITGTFNVNSYKLTYMVDGEEYKTIGVEYGAGITPEAEPTKEGYTFSGWSIIPETMPAHDVTITGSFTFVDAIEGVLADDGEHQIYTLDGMPIETLQKGVNIIKYINGKVKKVVVK